MDPGSWAGMTWCHEDAAPSPGSLLTPVVIPAWMTWCHEDAALSPGSLLTPVVIPA